MDTSDVLERLRRLAEELEYLRSKRANAPAVENYIQDQDLRKQIEYSLQIAAQICIDIANYFVSYFGLNPDHLEGIYAVFARQKLLSDELAQWLSASVRFRNILVHRYLIVDPVKVYEVWQNELDRFDEFAKAVTQWIEQAQADETTESL